MPGQQEVQVSKKIGSDSVQVFARGNKALQVSFSVSTLQTDALSALRAAATYFTQLPVSGDLVLSAVDPATDYLTLLRFPGAVVQSHTPQLEGVSLVHSFQFLAGSATAETVPPTGYRWGFFPLTWTAWGSAPGGIVWGSFP